MGEAKRQDEVRREIGGVHYDLETAELTMRKEAAILTDAGDKMIAEGRGDPDFIRAQRYFDEARIQFVLGGMAATNAGVDRNNMLGAAARSMGLMFAGLYQVCIGNRERDLIDKTFRMTVIEAQMKPKESTDSEVKVDPMTAGHG